ncbi:diguanylate cyclase [Evansella tamaricis]|uniref:Diguanylate cyclase n=1 Tax=Evansella tamaricis TaxID=2069301 RepID=A0ABS6JC60_9BACI|nr:diguanylate cyclase [Evansella tamaricis]MBU9711161.1 diguanylate cyclase [Evansella tamaricis]
MKETSKYEKRFFERVVRQLGNLNAKDFIEEREMYLFLHNIKGTAGSIGLEKLSEEVEEKLLSLSPESTRSKPLSEWIENLSLLASLIPVKEIDDPQDDIMPQINNENAMILIVDENIDALEGLKTKLDRSGFLVVGAVSEEKIREWIFTENIDLIITRKKQIDLGAAVYLKKLLYLSKPYFTPVVLITHETDSDKIIRTYQMGVSDVITMDTKFEVLQALLKNRIELRKNFTKSLMIDEVTGAFNKKYLDHEFQKIFNDYTREKKAFSVVMIDLDHFKKVNDHYGHMTGDRVLKQFVTFINENKRKMDTLIRVGGEEFCMLLPQTNTNQANLFINRLREGFSKIPFEMKDNHFFVTFSAGITEVSNETQPLKVLMEEADLALYKSKNNGRNQVSIYNQQQGPIKKTLNIIIVDDDPIIRDILRSHFSNEHFNDWEIIVHTYKDGSELLEANWYHSHQKYLFLLDGVMPKLDGMELLKILRANYPDREMLVIMLTARKSEQEIVRSLEIGADDYMIKPFKINELSSRIKRLMRRVWIR